jgi:hypothetical protein
MPPRNIPKHSIAEKWFFKQVAWKYPTILLAQYCLDLSNEGFYGSMEKVRLLELDGVPL